MHILMDILREATTTALLWGGLVHLVTAACAGMILAKIAAWPWRLGVLLCVLLPVVGFVVMSVRALSASSRRLQDDLQVRDRKRAAFVSGEKAKQALLVTSTVITTVLGLGLFATSLGFDAVRTSETAAFEYVDALGDLSVSAPIWIGLFVFACALILALCGSPQWGSVLNIVGATIGAGVAVIMHLAVSTINDLVDRAAEIPPALAQYLKIEEYLDSFDDSLHLELGPGVWILVVGAIIVVVQCGITAALMPKPWTPEAAGGWPQGEQPRGGAPVRQAAPAQPAYAQAARPQQMQAPQWNQSGYQQLPGPPQPNFQGHPHYQGQHPPQGRMPPQFPQY